jgi:hypothetical protein
MRRGVILTLLALFFATGALSTASITFPGLGFSKYLFYAVLFLIVTVLLMRIFQNHKEIILSLAISLLIVAAVIGASIYFNKQTMVFDVGAVQEKSDGINSLSPKDRVSLKKAAYFGDELITYRELLSSLVYTDISVPKKFDRISFKLRFQDNFPTDGMYVGLKNGIGWNYTVNRVYDPKLNLTAYNYISDDGLYLYYKGEKEYNSVKDFLDFMPTDKTIAYDNKLLENKENQLTWEEGIFSMNSKLRGSFELYVYAKGDLVVDFVKEDMNGYNNSDIYNVTLLDYYGNVIMSKVIEDDGINYTSTRKEKQFSDFIVQGLDEGVYRLSFVNSNADSTISDIHINQKKVVFNKYAFTLDKMELYSEWNAFKMQTYHAGYKQKIFFNEDVLNISKEKQDFFYSSSEPVIINITKGDIVINAADVFSTSQENYFYPSMYKLYALDNLDKSKIDTDFLLLNYHFEKNAYNWTAVDFTINNNGLYYEDKLSVMLNAKHLGNKMYANYTIPIDYIEAKYE